MLQEDTLQEQTQETSKRHQHGSLTYPQLPAYRGQSPAPSVSSGYTSLGLFSSVFLQLL